ncbi:hypothetical protein ACOBR2_00645 [Telmatobacter bradus]|uniref:hypothetical protein n=1 Tax=Telmatobacter bradus TaxID=474953 RepID=UPI003B427F90
MQRLLPKRLRFTGFGWKAVLCLALIALLAFAQVAHVHITETDLDHCPLCVVLQTAAPVAFAVMLIVLVEVGRRTPRYERIAVVSRCRSRQFIRPPPENR